MREKESEGEYEMSGDSEFPDEGVPSYGLRRVATEGDASPAIFRVATIDSPGDPGAGRGFATTRKGFLSSMSAAAALLLLEGCATDREAGTAGADAATPAPSPTSAPAAGGATPKPPPKPTATPAPRAAKPRKAIRLGDDDLSDSDLPILGMPETVERMEYEVTDASGAITREEAPCGTSLPADAVCTCNCVAIPAVTPIPARYAPSRPRPAAPPEPGPEESTPAPRERGAYSTRDRSERPGPREDADPRKIPERE